HALADVLAKSLSLSPLVANFLRLLVDRHRLTEIPVIARSFAEMVDEKVGRVRAMVTSAKPLSEEELRRVREVLPQATRRGIVRLYGLSSVMAGELVELPHDLMGLVLNLEEDNVGVAVMGEGQEIREGDVVKRTGRIAEVPVGQVMVGRVVNALGQPVDGKGPISSK